MTEATLGAVRDNLKRGPHVLLSPPTITCGECGYSTPLVGRWGFYRDDRNTISGIRQATWSGMPGSELDFDTCRCGARFLGGVLT